MAVQDVSYETVAQKEVQEKNVTSKPKYFGRRHRQCLLLFVCITVLFIIRNQMSIAIVAMIKNKTKFDENLVNNNRSFNFIDNNKTNTLNNNISSYEKQYQEQDLFKESVFQSYDWEQSKEEIILYSFFVGYTTFMLPMGIVVSKYGGKLPIVMALGVNGFTATLTPWAAFYMGWIGVSLCRFIQGFAQAAIMPATHTILGKWAPLSERGRMSTYVYTGNLLGVMLSFLLSGYLAGSSLLGWPFTFWIFGVASLVCCALFAWIGHSSPYDDNEITEEEFQFITGETNADIIPKKRKIPWKQIISSKPVWAIMIAHVGNSFGYLFTTTQIPTYMNKVLSVEIKKSGLYSSLPFVAMFFMILAFGALSDYCANKKILSLLNIRRIANTIGTAISPLFLIAFGYVQNQIAAVILLIINLGLHSSIFVGFHINHIDLAPNFAGSLMSMDNTLANLTSLLVPVMVYYVLKDDYSNQSRWQWMFIIITIIQGISNLIFVIYAKANVQTWNFYGDQKDDNSVEMDSLQPKKKYSISKN